MGGKPRQTRQQWLEERDRLNPPDEQMDRSLEERLDKLELIDIDIELEWEDSPPAR